MRNLKMHGGAIAQTFFLSDWRVGIAAVACLLGFAPQLALCGIFVSISARLLAPRCGVSSTLVDSGLVVLNAWFAGLAVGTFFLPGAGMIAALLLAAPLTVAATVALDRLLSPWQLPLLVAAYVPAFALIWLALSTLPWVHLTPTESLPAAASLPHLFLLGTLRSIGQIFFFPDARLGTALLLILLTQHWRLVVLMCAAALASEMTAWALGAPLWQVEQGLHGFSSALMAAAVFKGFKGLGWGSLGATIVLSPLVEMAVLRLGATLGVFGLSASYVAVVWMLLLTSPVQVKGPEMTGWGALRVR